MTTYTFSALTPTRDRFTEVDVPGTNLADARRRLRAAGFTEVEKTPEPDIDGTWWGGFGRI